MPRSAGRSGASGARARLQPRIAELQRRHRNDPQRLQAELGALYRAEGSGMFGGFLPLLIQLPFFSIMYRLFLDHSVGGAPNTLLTHSLLAAPAGQSLAGRRGPAQRAGRGVRGAVRAAGGGRGAGRPGRPAGGPRESRPWPAAPAPPARSGPCSGGPAGPGDPCSSGPRSGGPCGSIPGGRAIGVVTWIVPFASLVTAAIVPLAAGLYLLTTTAWTLAERTVLRRRVLAAMPPPPAS